jgi:inner membrane protein
MLLFWMIKRTHIVIALALALLFLPHVNYKLIFFPVVLVCALLPDIDSPNSFLGSIKIFKPLQFAVKHRGIFHSFTLCILVALALAFFAPLLALPFFLGYSSHLIADSFTEEGIMPFWPWKRTTNGPVRTGGRREWFIFIGFIVLDVLFFIGLFI